MVKDDQGSSQYNLKPTLCHLEYLIMCDNMSLIFRPKYAVIMSEFMEIMQDLMSFKQV